VDVSLLMSNEHPLLLASVRLAVNLPRPDSRSEKVAFLKQHPNDAFLVSSPSYPRAAYMLHCLCPQPRLGWDLEIRRDAT
jgi:hypothetical protein